MNKCLTVMHQVSMDAAEGTAMDADRLTEDLEAVNRDLLWRRLSLSPAQLAQLAGISRSLAYRWAMRGFLIPCLQNPMRFNGMAVEQAIVMRHAVERGYLPEQAAHFAKMRLARQPDPACVAAEPGGEQTRRLLVVQDFLEAALKMALLDLHDATTISKAVRDASGESGLERRQA